MQQCQLGGVDVAGPVRNVERGDTSKPTLASLTVLIGAFRNKIIPRRTIGSPDSASLANRMN
jgi:hypothetical protein